LRAHMGLVVSHLLVVGPETPNEKWSWVAKRAHLVRCQLSADSPALHAAEHERRQDGRVCRFCNDVATCVIVTVETLDHALLSAHQPAANHDCSH
jgi:hypothetical protein